jgi:DNA-binding CsgD family transcriptional regulator
MITKKLAPLDTSEFFNLVHVKSCLNVTEVLEYFEPYVEKIANYAIGPHYWFITDNASMKMLACSENINQFVPYTYTEWMKPEGSFERCTSLYHPADRDFIFAGINFAMRYQGSISSILRDKLKFNIYARMTNKDGNYSMCLMQFPFSFFNENNENVATMILTTDISHLNMRPNPMMTVLDHSQPEAQYFKVETVQQTIRQLNIPKITAREQDIIHAMAKGYTTPQIAKNLNISYNTVENHKQNLRAKSGCKTSAELLNYVWENGLI